MNKFKAGQLVRINYEKIPSIHNAKARVIGVEGDGTCRFNFLEKLKGSWDTTTDYGIGEDKLVPFCSDKEEME